MQGKSDISGIFPCITPFVGHGCSGSNWDEIYPFGIKGDKIGPDKTPNILQTTFPNAFSSKEIFKFRLIFRWPLPLRVQLILSQNFFRTALSYYQSQWLCNAMTLACVTRSRHSTLFWDNIGSGKWYFAQSNNLNRWWPIIYFFLWLI